MSVRKAPVRRCSWRGCSKPAAARVRFVLPNLLAGSKRDYCQPHTELVCHAKGTRVMRRFGPRQPTLPGLGEAASSRDADQALPSPGKGVVP